MKMPIEILEDNQGSIAMAKIQQGTNDQNTWTLDIISSEKLCKLEPLV